MQKTLTQDRDQKLLEMFRLEMQKQLAVTQSQFRNEMKVQLHAFGEVHIDPLRDDVRILKSQMYVMDKNIDMLNVRLRTVEDKIDSMEGKIDVMEEKIDNLDLTVKHVDGFLRKKFTETYMPLAIAVHDSG